MLYKMYFFNGVEVSFELNTVGYCYSVQFWTYQKAFFFGLYSHGAAI